MIFKVISNSGHPMILRYGKTQLHLAELILRLTILYLPVQHSSAAGSAELIIFTTYCSHVSQITRQAEIQNIPSKHENFLFL